MNVRNAFLLLVFYFVIDSDVYALNWAKAMNTYYSDFHPLNEMLFTLGLIIAFGVGTYIYQRMKKARALKKKQSRMPRKEFNDFL